MCNILSVTFITLTQPRAGYACIIYHIIMQHASTTITTCYMYVCTMHICIDLDLPPPRFFLSSFFLLVVCWHARARLELQLRFLRRQRVVGSSSVGACGGFCPQQHKRHEGCRENATRCEDEAWEFHIHRARRPILQLQQIRFAPACECTTKQRANSKSKAC